MLSPKAVWEESFLASSSVSRLLGFLGVPWFIDVLFHSLTLSSHGLLLWVFVFIWRPSLCVSVQISLIF